MSSVELSIKINESKEVIDKIKDGSRFENSFSFRRCIGNFVLGDEYINIENKMKVCC